MPSSTNIPKALASKAGSAATRAVNDPDKVEVKAHIKSGKMKGRKVTVLLDADDIVKEQVGGFVNFVREHAIVGLAVGFIVGQQAQGVVKQLITSFIDPTLQLLIGQKLANLSFSVTLGSRTGTYPWGAMVVVLLNLLFVLAVIYALIKIFNLDKLDKPKDKPVPAPEKAEAASGKAKQKAAEKVRASKQAKK